MPRLDPLMALLMAGAATLAAEPFEFTVTPAATGNQLVRASLPFDAGQLGEPNVATVQVSTPTGPVPASLRPVTWHPAAAGAARSVRRGLLTFVYAFADRRPVTFTVQPQAQVTTPPRRVQVTCAADAVTIAWPDGTVWTARLLAPARTSTAAATTEVVEDSTHYRWVRVTFADEAWPRVVEWRADVLGGVVLVAHLQRLATGDGHAPELGWELTTPGADARLLAANGDVTAAAPPFRHPFASGLAAGVLVGGTRRLDLPTAPFDRRGSVAVRAEGNQVVCRYLRCTADEQVPLQQAAWRRATLSIQPAASAPLTAALLSPHGVTVAPERWRRLYRLPAPPPGERPAELAALTAYHHRAVVRTALVGDDWGNLTHYNDSRPHGTVHGMNRLNHCPPIFYDGWVTGDRDLVETACRWCDNFHDLSIWWGPGQTGGTRYNNVLAMKQPAPFGDHSFMWRSNSAVSFCTKGYDTFHLAWEETGDPRMRAALDAQVAYAEQHLNAGANYTRNIGDVRDCLALLRDTGDERYLRYALRLFADLRPLLSTGDLFTETGKPITANPPFIYDDTFGYANPFAKPYIIGYALAGLPELLRLRPDEPKLRAVVQAVADFLAASQDPLGGWRYPHPRSQYLSCSQALEHAWQLVQADRVLGPQPAHLDAIERVLRTRLHSWQRTGQLFSGVSAWELVEGKAKTGTDFGKLYARPEERDFHRDYTHGRLEVGGSPPEGLVYFGEVLDYYLAHRPAARLLAQPSAEEPLGQVTARLPARTK